MADLEARIRELVDRLEVDAADDEATRGELVAEHGDQHPDVARLTVAAETTRGVVDDIRRALGGAS